jgi:hypothetical protein
MASIPQPPRSSLVELWKEPNTPATFNGMLASTLRRQLLRMSIDKAMFFEAVAHELSELKDGRRYAMERTNLIRRLTAPTMSVKTFRQALKMFAIQQLAIDAILIFHGDEHGVEHQITSTITIEED